MVGEGGGVIVIRLKEPEFSKLKGKFEALGKGKRFRYAVSRAINRTAIRARAEGSRKIKKKLGANIGAIKRYILELKKAHPNRLNASLTAHNTAISLGYFAARQRKTGVSAAPWRRRRFYPGAFLRRGGSGFVAAYWRSGMPRPAKRRTYRGKPVPAMVRPSYPIKKIMVPTWATVWQQVLEDAYFNAIVSRYEMNLSREITYELNYRK